MKWARTRPTWKLFWCMIGWHRFDIYAASYMHPRETARLCCNCGLFQTRPSTHEDWISHDP
jgi:hypothetical protein